MSFEFLNQGQSDDTATKFQPIDTFIDPVSKIRVSNPSNLIDTDFEYGLQPTKWETVEIINNTPAFFSKSGDTTIPDIVAITTNAGTREITVTTAFPHNLAVGIPIRVSGTKSVTADGSYIINATPALTTFTYLSRANQPETISIFDLYTSIITGEFFQGSQIAIADAEGITTDAQGPISTLTVKTRNKHGFGLNTPFYFLNLNSTISQEFQSNNDASVSFDPTNSATAQTFDGSNTQLKTPIDLSNSATTSLYEANITSSNPTEQTITVNIPQNATPEWETLKEGDPLYYDINAGSGYFQSNPRKVVFIKSTALVDTNQGVATFQISEIPGGAPINVIANITGIFKIANQAVTFPGNNQDLESQISLNVVIEDSFIFDGGNQGYEGEPESPPNNTSDVLGWSGTSISLFTSEGDLDYYPGAMLLYTTDGTPPNGLTNGRTYFVNSFEPGVSGGLFNMSIEEFPGDGAIQIDGTPASGSQQFAKIGISIDKDIVHVRDAGFAVGDMVEYQPPSNLDIFVADFQQNYYFIEKAYDSHNFKLNDNPFVPIIATGGNTVEDIFYDGRTYRVHTFTSTGTTTFNIEDIGSEGEVEFMVVAGGGGGGNYNTTNANGGGGGGGILYKKKHVLDSTGPIDVTVGAGGGRRTYRQRAAGNDGQDSAFGSFVAEGGGGGGARYSGGYNNRPGGSGGGKGRENTYYTDNRYNLGVTTQRPIEGAESFGNDGGNMTVDWTGGGGGGANFMARITPVFGGQGSRGGRSAMGGWGGWGQAFDIEGRVKFYAGGGGGGANSSERAGDGMHGGGRGFGTISTYNYNQYRTDTSVTNGTSGGNLGLDAIPSTGGGGGGGTYWENNVSSWRYRGSGSGGSGIVVIRYPITPEPEFVPMVATGGDEVLDVVDKDGYWRIHKFTSTGTSSLNVTQLGSHGVEFLVVAGGGSGGNGATTNSNGGGGGGGVVHSTSYQITSTGNITVTVGAGGARIPYRQDNNGNNGQDSYFGNFRARGGGGGGGRGSGGSRNPTAGGSGGGDAEYNNEVGNNNTQPAITTGSANGPNHDASGFGNRGARRAQRWTGGGGGGAGTFGIDGNYQTYPMRAGDGGAGYYSTIEGEVKWYAGGGGGGSNSNERGGDGWHGGGRGFGRTTYFDTQYHPNAANGGQMDPRTLGNRTLDGLDNYGGGGGAGSYWENNVSQWRYRGSGKGGDGTVIVRYRLAPPNFFGYEGRMVATGGEEKDIVVSDGANMTLYRVHMFRYPGTHEFDVEDIGRLSTEVDYLIVAGGGGGGSDMGGGGGAGGVLQGSTVVDATTYTVQVGRGGRGHSGSYDNYPDHGENGIDSSFAGLVAIGGGAGSSGHYGNNGDRRVGGTSKEATDGGSGGGGSAAYRSVSLGRPPGRGTPGQGTDGGYGKYASGEYQAGAGGGAGGNSEVNFVASSRAGNGGPGVISDILGIPYYFGGGGGGAAHNESNKAGNGGIGGGAPGSRWRQEYEPYRIGHEGYGGINMGEHPHFENGYYRNGAHGGANTGGGGGGGLHQGRGGNGGSGIVVVRYPISTPRSIT